jgi:DNA replication licensing factor MCM5
MSELSILRCCRFREASGITLPRVCARPPALGEAADKCPLDPYFVVHEKCQFIDQQILIARSTRPSSGWRVATAYPGFGGPIHDEPGCARVKMHRNGVFSIYQSKGSKSSSNSAVAIRNPYLRAVGINSDVDHTAKGNAIFPKRKSRSFWR